MGLSIAASQEALDAVFPTTGGDDYLMWSENGSSESANLARLQVGATGWAAATSADPSVKSNNAQLTSAGASGPCTITHVAVINDPTAGTQQTDWQALDTSRTLAIGEKLQIAIGDLDITLT